MKQARCYSRRLLNPFRGTMQVVSIDNGDAESSDGVNWTLYVNHEDIVSHTGMSEIRYGSWSQENGLKLSVVRGTATNRLIEEVGEDLLAALLDNFDQVPFPPADRHECWLMSAEGKPLVLLESALDDEQRQVYSFPAWQPGQAARQAFASKHGDAETLKTVINERAGERPSARWFTRCFTSSFEREKTEQVAFPNLLLVQHWPAESEQKLIADYIYWQAPWLLQLQHLTQNVRAELEQQAWKRPVLCDEQFRLFARVLDEKSLKVARVQARLMGAGGQGQATLEAFIDTGDKDAYSP